MPPSVNDAGKTTWKVYGPDLNGRYGGLNGLGGFDAIVPGVDVFCPVIADARGNLVAVYDQDHGFLKWFESRPTGYGAVPGRRPLPLGHGGDAASASAWRGRWSDVSGLYSIGMRYYDPAAGHFLSADPLGHGATWDLYSAFSGDPINRFDPDGRFTRVTWAAGTGFAEGAGEGLWNEVVGVGHFAKGMSYDLGQQISLTAFDTYGAYFDGDDYEFESAAFRGVSNMAAEGATGGDMAGELAMNVAGIRFAQQIGANFEHGWETGDYTQFSQNMGQVAGMAAATALTLSTRNTPQVPGPGEDLFVGLYGESRQANLRSGLNATHTPHHVVQDAVSGTSRYSGVTINLEQDLHRLTRTYGRNADLGSNVRNLAADVRDLRSILRDAGYDRSLVNQQMQRIIELNRQVGNVP